MVADFNKKRKGKFFGRGILFSLGGILLCMTAAALIFIDFRMYHRKKELISQIESYQKQIEALEKGNQELREGIANIDNIDYLEKIAYEQLGEQKPGEKAVIFVTPEEKPKESMKPENFWTGWLSGIWSWIKDRF